MKKLEQLAKKRKEILKGYPTLAQKVTKIREKTVTNLPKLIEESKKSLEGKKSDVYFAKTSEDAKRTIADILRGQEQVVRTNSSTLQEIDFDKLLNKNGTKVFKTNVIEIIKEELKAETEGHPIIPYLDIGKEKVVEALQKYLNSNSNDYKELNRAIQAAIKDKIIKSQYGCTGANNISAENGTLVLAEDEGNARLVSNLPYRHIAVVGIEKINSSVEECMDVIQATTIYGLGRNTSTYMSLISGPSRTADIELRMAYGMHGPKEVKVILLDNGRQKLVEQKCGDILKCIDCGSCFKSCLKLTEANGWKNITLTPKNIALNIVQEKIEVKKLDEIDVFECPVGLDGKQIENILKNVRP